MRGRSRGQPESGGDAGGRPCGETLEGHVAELEHCPDPDRFARHGLQANRCGVRIDALARENAVYGVLKEPVTVMPAAIHGTRADPGSYH